MRDEHDHRAVRKMTDERDHTVARRGHGRSQGRRDVDRGVEVSVRRAAVRRGGSSSNDEGPNGCVSTPRTGSDHAPASPSRTIADATSCASAVCALVASCARAVRTATCAAFPSVSPAAAAAASDRARSRSRASCACFAPTRTLQRGEEIGALRELGLRGEQSALQREKVIERLPAALCPDPSAPCRWA